MILKRLDDPRKNLGRGSAQNAIDAIADRGLFRIDFGNESTVVIMGGQRRGGIDDCARSDD